MLVRVFEELCGRQDGVVTRRQALEAGRTPAQIRAALGSRRWQRLSHGIYATFSGPVPRPAALWAAVLHAGTDAVLSHETAAELWGLIDQPAEAIHVTVPSGRRMVPVPGLVQHLSLRATAARHPTREPPQTRIEETVIDLTQSSRDLDRAIGWLARACGRRLTTPDRLAVCLADRRRAKWREELMSALDDVADGCHSLVVIACDHGGRAGQAGSGRTR